MERRSEGAPRTRAAFRTLQVVDSSNLELLFSSNISSASSAPAAPAEGALYRIKRRRDEPLETIVLESTTAKKASISSISKALGSLSTQDAQLTSVIVAPASTTLTNPNVVTTATSVRTNAGVKKGPKVFRRLETISARVASERGLMAIVESIKRHREESGDNTRQKAASRKQAASRQQAREKVLESTRQLNSSADDEKKSQPPQFPLAASLKPTRPAPPSQEEILLNYMPLVRKFLTSEREKEAADVARKEAEGLDAELDEYSVEIFAEAENADLTEGQGLRVKIEPFDFDPANEYASDDQNDSDYESDDSNDAEHPNNDYPDSEEEEEEEEEDEDGKRRRKKKQLHDEDDEDEDEDDSEVDDVMESSDEEDLAWAAGPAKYRAYHQRAADSDDSDE